MGMKHDVEIAVIDARVFAGEGEGGQRAWTMREVVEGAGKEVYVIFAPVCEKGTDGGCRKEGEHGTVGQGVLVYGAVPSEAVYASVPLTDILKALPGYFFTDDVDDGEREMSGALLRGLVWEKDSTYGEYREALRASFAGRPERAQVRDATRGARRVARVLGVDGTEMAEHVGRWPASTEWWEEHAGRERGGVDYVWGVTCLLSAVALSVMALHRSQSNAVLCNAYH